MKNLLLSTLLVLFSNLLVAQVQQANLLGQWFDDSLVGSAFFDNAYNEIWGIAVNGREFAVIGTTAGTHFIDVTDPTNPTQVQFVEGAVTGPSIIHRDYHDDGCFLYAVADEPGSINAPNKSTLQIIDIRNLPNSIEVVYDSDELIFRAHNIFIDEANSVLYACIANGTANPGFSAMRVFDISDPRNPVFLAIHDQIDGLPIQQVHDGYFLDNIGYLNLGPGAFAIADFSDPVNPVLMGTLNNYPDQGYNHSGWLSQDGSYYYLADETHGLRIKVLDVSDPSDIEVVNFLDAGNPSPTSIPHNLLVACDYLYVSYYYDGLQVYDISDPANPVRIFEFDTSNEPDDDNFKGAWGVYPFLPSGNILVSDMQEGLFVFEAIDQGACEQRRQVCEGITISTTEIDKSGNFSITPNPAQDFISISLENSLSENVEVRLSDITGRVISANTMAGLVDNMRIDLPSGFASGVYLITIQSEAGLFSQKLVVE